MSYQCIRTSQFHLCMELRCVVSRYHMALTFDTQLHIRMTMESNDAMNNMESMWCCVHGHFKMKTFIMDDDHLSICRVRYQTGAIKRNKNFISRWLCHRSFRTIFHNEQIITRVTSYKSHTKTSIRKNTTISVKLKIHFPLSEFVK